MARTIREEGFRAARSNPSWTTLVLVVALHVLAIVGLIRAFAPDLPAALVERAASLASVTIDLPPPPEPATVPEPSPVLEDGAAAPEAPRATPRPVLAPRPPVTIPRTTVAPPAISTGTANEVGAGQLGTGTGAGGDGSGTGSGTEGTGVGAAISPPVKIAGEISDARDYPIPPGGREIRRGHHVIVHMTVGIDGRASNCRVVQPSPDPEADRITCRLAEQRFRFRPARDASGNPVAAPFGWRQDWF